MTRDEFDRAWEKLNSDDDGREFLHFERVENPRHSRPDLAALSSSGRTPAITLANLGVTHCAECQQQLVAGQHCGGRCGTCIDKSVASPEGSAGLDMKRLVMLLADVIEARSERIKDLRRKLAETETHRLDNPEGYAFWKRFDEVSLAKLEQELSDALALASALPSLIDASTERDDWKELAAQHGESLAESAREINCAGTIPHRIRILKQEHAAQLIEARARISELEFELKVRDSRDSYDYQQASKLTDYLSRTYPMQAGRGSGDVAVEVISGLRSSREQSIVAIEALPVFVPIQLPEVSHIDNLGMRKMDADPTLQQWLRRSAVLSILRGTE